MNISKTLKDVVRYWYYMPKRFRLKNKEPTILCMNCVGGMIYHDMRLQFRSPTVNLFICHNDFLCFLENIEYYLRCEIEEIDGEGEDCPVGLMRRGDETVKLHFVHFHTFEEAVKKWQERCARVDLNNAFVIMEYAPIKEDDAWWHRICALPFKNKAILTGDTAFEHPDLVHIDIYNEPYVNGRIFAIKPGTILHRWLDDFDYVGFFNRNI